MRALGPGLAEVRSKGQECQECDRGPRVEGSDGMVLWGYMGLYGVCSYVLCVSPAQVNAARRTGGYVETDKKPWPHVWRSGGLGSSFSCWWSFHKRRVKFKKFTSWGTQYQNLYHSPKPQPTTPNASRRVAALSWLNNGHPLQR